MANKYSGDAFADTEEIEEIQSEVDTPEVSKFGAFIRGAAQEGTFGFQDEIEAKLKSLANPNSTYEEHLEAVRALNKIAEKQQPGAYKSGEYGAMLATLAPLVVSGGGTIPALARVLAKFGIKGGTKLAGKAGKEMVKAGLKKGRTAKSKKALTKDSKKYLKRKKKGVHDSATKRAMSEARDKVIKEETKEQSLKELGKEMGSQVALGGGFGGLEALGKSEKADIGGQIKDAYEGAKTGAIWGMVFPAGKLLLKGGKGITGKGIELLSSLSEEQVEWLRKNPELFRMKDSIEDVKKRFLKQINSLEATQAKFKKKADDVLEDEYASISKSDLVNSFDDFVEKEKERLLPKGRLGDKVESTKPLTPINQKYFEELAEQRNRILSQPDVLTEKQLNSMRTELNDWAYKYNDPYNKDKNEQLAVAFKQVTHGWKNILADSNPAWNKAMEPVRKIQGVLGGNERIGEIGIRDYFKLKKVPGKALYNAREKLGAEGFGAQFVKTVAAPFVDRGLEKHRHGRDLVSKVTDLTNQYVRKAKKPKGKGMLAEGEGAALRWKASQKSPETGFQKLYAEPVEQMVAPSVGDVSKLISSVVAIARQRHGKEWAAKVMTNEELQRRVNQARPVREMGAKLIGDPLAVPRVVRHEFIESEQERKPVDKAKQDVLEIIKKKRRDVQQGERFGLPGFEGVKGVKKEQPPEPPPFLQRPTGGFMETEGFDLEETEIDPEKRKREKDALQFLQQQRGLRKPKYS
jgi:hypothetical protein